MDPRRRPPTARLSWVRAVAACGLLVGLFFMHGLTTEHGGQLPVVSADGHATGLGPMPPDAMMPNAEDGANVDSPKTTDPMLDGHGLAVMCLAVLSLGLVGLLRARGHRAHIWSGVLARRVARVAVAMAEVARGSPHYLRPTLSSLGISRT